MTGVNIPSDRERLEWLRLWRTEHVGPVTFLDLLRVHDRAGDALQALPELARRGGLKRVITPYPLDRAERELEALAKLGGRLITLRDPAYPTPLAAIADPPPVISVLGDARMLDRDMIAIVGARNASAAGGRFARGLASELGGAGIVVVSGLARGIDTDAHNGALDTGTVAVMAGGVDVVYPPENRNLHRKILQGGAVISEQPLGLAPRSRHFPRRNRIISGLALGVVVVEASLRSGSLITARLAGEQGRDVFAVPGSPLDPRHRGTNRLIRDGAGLTETAEDVLGPLEALRRDFRLTPPTAAQTTAIANDSKPLEVNDSQREAVLHALSPTPVGVDELVRRCHLTAAEVMVIVLELELAGRARRHRGGTVSVT